MAKSLIAVDRTILVGEEPEPARERFSNYFSGWMAAGNYQATWPSPMSVSYVHRYFYTWQIVVAILFFPLGLLALLAEKREARFDAFFEEAGESKTRIRLSGAIPPGTAAKQLADRIDSFDPDVPSNSPPNG